MYDVSVLVASCWEIETKGGAFYLSGKLPEQTWGGGVGRCNMIIGDISQ